MALQSGTGIGMPDTATLAITAALFLLALVVGGIVVARAVARRKGRRPLPGPPPSDLEAPGTPAPGPAQSGAAPCVISGLNKAQAEELLDWLQGNGRNDCELIYEPGSGYTVRARRAFGSPVPP